MINNDLKTKQTAHEILRTKTAQSHKNIEKTCAMQKLMGKNVNITDYANVLNAWLTWFNANEVNVQQLLQDFSPKDIHLRVKAPAIKKDLEHFLLKPIVLPKIELPKMPLQNKFEALGALYVIEGASLGSSIIVKRLRKTLDQRLTHYFYAGYQESTYIMWDRFLKHLDGRQLTNIEIEQVANGAIATFNNLSAIFNLPLFKK